MRDDPFVTLGIERGATQNEIYNAYKALRNKYEEERFMEGEAGADAAKKLQQLDLAYAEAIEFTHSTATVSGDLSGYSEIKKAISEKKLDDAQSMLDSITRRDAEWHYYQSIVFYERSWFAECKKQLQIALEIDPSNEKYKKALSNLDAKLNKKEQTSEQSERHYEQSSQSYGAGSGRSYSQGNAADGVCAACQGLLCADCCCECMGGDLIRCC